MGNDGAGAQGGDDGAAMAERAREVARRRARFADTVAETEKRLAALAVAGPRTKSP